MITIEQIKEYTKCPQFGDKDYGKWGALRPEQREAYRHLIDIIEGMEKEIDRLNKIIEYILDYLRGNEKRLEKLFPYDSAIYGEVVDRLERKLKGEDKE